MPSGSICLNWLQRGVALGNSIGLSKELTEAILSAVSIEIQVNKPLRNQAQGVLAVFKLRVFYHFMEHRSVEVAIHLMSPQRATNIN